MQIAWSNGQVVQWAFGLAKTATASCWLLLAKIVCMSAVAIAVAIAVGEIAVSAPVLFFLGKQLTHPAIDPLIRSCKSQPSPRFPLALIRPSVSQRAATLGYHAEWAEAPQSPPPAAAAAAAAQSESWAQNFGGFGKAQSQSQSQS
ncbi:hypothetical protein AWZ03_007789 [Drosophila navojoa]|uniref:Uncharacterized protein n=1 Tax=Drosophila navojoa TaxID=7232 RepID=A0A484BAZ8_DRONA|nr:hypothetical protein AWZ03_007789 [Drosophila navojoa]